MRVDQCCGCGAHVRKGGKCAACQIADQFEEDEPVLAADESWGDDATDDNVRAIEAGVHSDMFASEVYFGELG